MEICGPIKLILYASTTAHDTDFFIKLSDHFLGLRMIVARAKPVCGTHHARLAARIAPRHRPGAQHRHGAVPQPR
jgi:hypothetical protein